MKGIKEIQMGIHQGFQAIWHLIFQRKINKKSFANNKELQKFIEKDLSKFLKNSDIGSYIKLTSHKLQKKIAGLCNLLKEHDLKVQNPAFTSPQLRCLEAILKQIDNIHLEEVRILLARPSKMQNKNEDEKSTVKDYFNEEEDEEEEQRLELVDAPYLSPLPKEIESATYTLVLDLDETLVHYYEV